ncbi:hypothetical protein [Leptolyngbya sp. 7M]|uniref:hypothetical protein n=1 Tax=Leptolyngbya sp. 7M TaxID=2812896 RepID=UPI001B8B1722|nr:hypothetical protein [Leptolyngbya sp. 7M]QYO66929.1 hypothetical protein JVX88_09040 [Leptolyngbya sp. 7M]
MGISEKLVQQQFLSAGDLTLQYFVDRKELIKLFIEYIHNSSLQKILFFHGDGGNGKSLLLKFLLQHGCKYFPENQQMLQMRTATEAVAHLQAADSWDFSPVPAVLHDFGQQPIGDERPQDPFYGLLMIHRNLMHTSRKQGYKLYFPLYEFGCICYLKYKGRLATDQLGKLFFPSEELFLAGGIASIFRTAFEDNLAKTAMASAIPYGPIAITLVAQVLSLFRKHKSGDLMVGYLQKRGGKDKDLQQDLEYILRLNPDTELINVLPSLFAEDLNVSMQKSDAPPRVVLMFDTHEAFWGDSRNQGDARFFKQDEWLRRLIDELDLSTRIRVVVCGREKPRWADASHYPIFEKLAIYSVEHLEKSDAHDYLRKVGIENDQLCKHLITYASGSRNEQEKAQVHPLYLGLCADIILAARNKGLSLSVDDFSSLPQTAQKDKLMIEHLLKYVDEDIRDAVDALSACRSFDQAIYSKLGKALDFNTTNASFRHLTRFSFIWENKQQGQGWYSIHPLIRRLNLKTGHEIIKNAHMVLEQHYREQGEISEAIYHAICQDFQRGVKEWLEVFKAAKQAQPMRIELCRTLLAIRKELNF